MQLYRPGSVVAERYEIKEVLGQGPVGATYLALDKELEEEVALKVIAAELLSAEALKEFEAIFDKVSNFSHRNLRKLYEYQVEGSMALYTGVYHKGESLRQMLQGRKVFTYLEAEPILSQICQALTAAEKITAHGALRPENILVLPDTVKITDLGIAAALGSTYIATLRKGGASRYLAPELKSGGAISQRSDVYSLGVLFYEMLSGEPYDGSVISFASANSSLPPALDDVAKIALAANPAERYANANEFADDLASVIDTGKINPRAIPSTVAAVSHMSLPALTPAGFPQETVITKPEESVLFPVSDDAIELSVIAAPKVPDVSRIENVSAIGGDNDRTVVRMNPASTPAMAALELDPDESTGLRNAPTRPPMAALSSKDPAEDLFDSALQQKPKTPDRRAPVSASAPPPMPAPNLPKSAPSGASAVEPTPSTALARASDIPPVVTPPAQGAVVLPGWALGMFGALLLGLFGVVIYLLMKPQPMYQPYPQQDPSALINKQPDTKPAPIIEPATKPQPVASTQVVASTSTSIPTTSPTSSTTGPASAIAVNTTNPAIDPKNPGVDPKVDPKIDPKIDPKLTPPVEVPKLACPPGMQKLTVGKDKREYCIDRYEFPNAKGATPQTGVDFGSAEATCKSKGKRLCTGEEWGRGCGGAYPYGKNFDATACNTKDADDNPRAVGPAGAFPKCKSGGVFDMSGNVEEWVDGGSKRGGSAKSGDTFATCGKSTKGGASEFTGFRCCADPK